MFKRSMFLLLTILILTVVPATAVPAHAAGKIKATSVKLDAKKATISPGKKKTITITMNKKSTKNVKVIIKSSKTSVAKVPAFVTVKKGKKSAQFKITAKNPGKAVIKVYFKKANGKYSNKATVQVTVSPIKLTGVTLNNKTPKIGDKLVATINPANATDVTYAWYSGNSARAITTYIEGATSSSLTITSGMAGKYIRVVAIGKKGRAEAATTAPVPPPMPPAPSGVYSAQIGTLEHADLNFDEDILIPLALYDYSNNPITDLKLATDSSEGVNILSPASASGAEIVNKNNTLYIKVNGAFCRGLSGPLDVKIKLLKTGTIVEKSIDLQGPAGIYDIVGYNNTFTEIASSYTINLENVIILDTNGNRLTGSNPDFWKYFTYTSDEEKVGKYRIIAEIPKLSKASFSKNGELKEIALDSTGAETTTLYNPEMESSITVTLHLQRADVIDKWEDLYNNGRIQYDVTFPD